MFHEIFGRRGLAWVGWRACTRTPVVLEARSSAKAPTKNSMHRREFVKRPRRFSRRIVKTALRRGSFSLDKLSDPLPFDVLTSNVGPERFCSPCRDSGRWNVNFCSAMVQRTTRSACTLTNSFLCFSPARLFGESPCDAVARLCVFV